MCRGEVTEEVCAGVRSQNNNHYQWEKVDEYRQKGGTLVVRMFERNRC